MFNKKVGVKTISTAKERILEVLDQHEGSICDDCMAQKALLSQRQESNQCCRNLAAQSFIKRYTGICSICGKTKKVNQGIKGGHTIPSVITPLKPSSLNLEKRIIPPKWTGKPWHWEGNIQSTLVSWLAKENYRIISVANTKAKTNGKDIIALTPAGKELWISVKGYPEKKANTTTNPSTQARHWFSSAIFDMVLYREENSDVSLALGLPSGFTTYSNFASRLTWLMKTTPFSIFWVDEVGKVEEQNGGSI